jgi:membrane protease YdiL (CAAX protease family)
MTMTLLDTRTEVPADVRSVATREVAVFLGATFSLLALSTSVGLAEGVDVRHIEDASALGQLSMYGQALFPTIGALIARATTPREKRVALGFRRPRVRSLGIAWACGLLATVLAGVLVWAFGLAGFASDELGLITVLGCTVLGLPYVVLALGEDLGWRGLMTTRLAQVTGPRTIVLLTGVLWGMFHWPLMLFLGGNPAHTPLWFTLAAFTIGTTALGAVLASMQLRWGIWPGLVMHAMVNAGLYHVVGPATTDIAHSGWFAGEVGLVQNLVLVALAVGWWRFAPLRRSPDGGTVAA